MRIVIEDSEVLGSFHAIELTKPGLDDRRVEIRNGGGRFLLAFEVRSGKLKPITKEADLAPLPAREKKKPGPKPRVKDPSMLPPDNGRLPEEPKRAPKVNKVTKKSPEVNVGGHKRSSKKSEVKS